MFNNRVTYVRTYHNNNNINIIRAQLHRLWGLVPTSDIQGMIWGEPELTMVYCYGNMYGICTCGDCLDKLTSVMFPHRADTSLFWLTLWQSHVG